MADEENQTIDEASDPGIIDEPHPETSAVAMTPDEALSHFPPQPYTRNAANQERGTEHYGSQLRFPTLIIAALLIALGIILLWPVFSGGFILVPAVIAAVVVVGLAFALIAYWLSTRRQARGALFLALLGITEVAVVALLVLRPEVLDANRGWPLFIAAGGLALLLTRVLDRRGDRKLTLGAVVVLIAGLAGLAVTFNYVPAALLDIARQGWPWILGALILGLLPAAFHRQSLDR